MCHHVFRTDSDGLISAYKETWDQSVPEVLRTIHFSKQFQ